ncbi:unnamed protein product [Phytomonas sp. Hart1]|nr:unnamed protein product [Phytomonas sp. Hart1]|eukprot:CCW67016.1 unnamed protein product [Phytomonas sp. isolate Hart1]
MENNNWITETLVQFIKSPVWLTPVNHFIDYNCNIFTNESEMKFEYTDIHRKFQSLIDDLLSGFVDELGISLEDVMASVRSSMESDQELEHKSIEDFMKYIYVMDDFESFFYMMIKRNIEQDIIAVRALQAKGVNLSVSDSENLLSIIDKSAQPTAEDIARILETNGKCDDEEALRRAISASLLEDPKEKEIKLEEAKMKEALALSAQAERDRAKRSASDSQKKVRHPPPKNVEAVGSKESEAATTHPTHTEHELADSSHLKSDADGKPTCRTPKSNQQVAHTEALVSAPESKAPTPTAAISRPNPSPSQGGQMQPLPALTTSKLQQTLGSSKLQPLPPI